MTISKPRRVPNQLPLFAGDDVPIRHVAESRWLCGDFFERLLAVLTRATRLRTDSRADICPDLRAVEPNLYYECKSVGRSGSGILYEKRLANDLAFCRHGHRLTYWFFRHDVAVEQIKWRKDLDAALAAGVQYAATLSVQALHKMLVDTPMRTMNTSYTKAGARLGYGSNGYGNGWPVPVKRICALATEKVLTNPLLFDGIVVPSFPIHHVTEDNHANVEAAQAHGRGSDGQGPGTLFGQGPD